MDPTTRAGMKRHRLTVLSALAVAGLAFILLALQGFVSQGAIDRDAAAAQPDSAAVSAIPQPVSTQKTSLRWGDNLATALMNEGVTRDEVNALVPIAGHLLDLGRIQVGTSLEIGLDDQGLARLTIQEPQKLESIVLQRTGPLLYVAHVERPELDTLIVRYEGSIETSFYQSCLDNGGSDALAATYYSVFRDVFYFNSETRRGDRYRMIVEEVREDGTPVGYGRVMVAEYDGARGQYTAVWGPLDGADEGGEYFDDNGYSYRRALMQIPFEDRVAVRVTSSYGNRYHPISGKWKKHNGVDLAAPMGTPVLAAGDGVIVRVGRNHPGYGNWLQIRHPNGYETRYGHMRRFAPGMRKGVRVKQGQKIGEVGMTGYATGPHLHYEVFSNGRRMNPRSIKTSPVKQLDEIQLASFLKDWYKPWVRMMAHPGALPDDRYQGPPLPAFAHVDSTRAKAVAG